MEYKTYHMTSYWERSQTDHLTSRIRCRSIANMITNNMFFLLFSTYIIEFIVITIVFNYVYE
jgi:hypothetical protein